MNKRYLDNASTSFPKPQTVSDAVYRFMTEVGSNINRGCYENAYSTEEVVFDTRQLLCDLFNGDNCKNVVFTKNVTESLNVLIKGLLKAGDHVLVSAMEHNAVMRPLNQLKEQGISFDRIPCFEDGTLKLDKAQELIKSNTKALIITHASNVCGTLMPLNEIGEFCRKNSIFFIVDAAQTAGVVPVDMKNMNIDALAFTGHKGLLGPQGIGGFLIKEELIASITPLISGGTGSLSHTETVPDFMPDRFEAGTLNLPGIMGLNAGLKWINEKGMDAILGHELSLTKLFLEGLSELEDSGAIEIVGKKNIEGRTGVVSIRTLKKEMSEVAFELDEHFGIMTRVGLHCAPNAHKTLGTFPEGTIRFSFGCFNDEDDVNACISALKEVLNGF